MTYEHLGQGGLDYSVCRYGKSKQLFRGPQRKLTKPYIATVGGSETYGKFVEKPFPAVLENLLGIQVANLGCVNAGIDAIAMDEATIDVCRQARVTVVQITGAQNLSNRYYSVHPRRNDRFLKGTQLLSQTYPDVDLTEFNFTRHLLTALKMASAEKFELIQKELSTVWVARMKSVVARIEGPVVLLWMADHTPGQNPREKPLGHDPMFVEPWMLDALRDQVVATVALVVSPDERSAGFERLIYTALEEPAAREMLGPIAHETAARQLHKILRPLVENENGPPI